MNLYNKQYLDLVESILNEGIEAPCRTGNKVLVKLNQHLTWDLNEGFPILTFRQIPFKGVKGELSCFLEGITDKKVFEERGCKYWNDWCNPKKVPYSDKEGMKKENDLGNYKYGLRSISYTNTLGKTTIDIDYNPDPSDSTDHIDISHSKINSITLMGFCIFLILLF